MYDTCSGCGGHDYNYAYDGPAKPMQDPNDAEELRSVCPELMHELGIWSFHVFNVARPDGFVGILARKNFAICI